MSRLLQKLAVCLLLLAPSGCGRARVFEGVDVSTGRSLFLEPREMAKGRTFTGEYVSPQLGRLSLKEHDGRIQGTYSYRSCGELVQGELRGRVVGNLAEVSWDETVGSCCLSQRLRRGEGYFLFSGPPPYDRPERLFGKRVYLVDRLMSRGGKPLRTERETSAWTAIALAPAAARTWAEEAHCP
jgi:hypothetical protein